MASVPAKTEVRLSRDAKIPRSARVTLDVTITYEIPWNDTLENLGEDEATINEWLADLATAYGRHTNLAYAAAQERWDILSDYEHTFSVTPLNADGGYEANDVLEVEQEWENVNRKQAGRYVPERREYREVLS